MKRSTPEGQTLCVWAASLQMTSHCVWDVADTQMRITAFGIDPCPSEAVNGYTRDLSGGGLSVP